MRILAILVLLIAFVPVTAAAASSGGAAAVEERAAGPTGGLEAGDGTDQSNGGGHVHDASQLAPPSPAASPPAATVAAEVPYGRLIATTARRRGVPVALFTALVWQESGFKARARSKAGARGLTQLMPGTARDLGVRRVYDPAENLDGGARYLRSLLDRFRSTTLALAAYNAGPAEVARHGAIPPYRETRAYVRSILALEARLRVQGVA